MAASPHAGTHTEPRFVRKIQQKSHRNVALRFRTSAPSAPAKSIAYVTRPRAKCRRWAKLSLALASVHPSATPIWPPTGFALAAVLLLGYRVSPAIFLGAFIANVTTAGSIGTSFAIATGNTLESLIGA